MTSQVDQEEKMAKKEWRERAKEHQDTLLYIRLLLQAFSEKAFKDFPELEDSTEEDLLDRILVGIEKLSKQEDVLQAYNKDLLVKMQKNSNDRVAIETFCATAMESLPGLQKKYEVCIPFSFDDLVAIHLVRNEANTSTANPIQQVERDPQLNPRRHQANGHR